MVLWSFFHARRDQTTTEKRTYRSPTGVARAQPGSRVMRRHLWIVLCAVLLVLLLGSFGIVWATNVPDELFIVPEATDIETRSYGFGEREITYRTPAPPYGWYFSVAHNLAAAGWMLPVDHRRAVRTRAEVYWRIRAIGPLYLKQEIVLQGEPHAARITVRRELIIPWRQYVPCALRPSAACT